MFKNKSPLSHGNHNLQNVSPHSGMFAQVLAQKGRKNKDNSQEKHIHENSSRGINKLGNQGRFNEEDISLECD